MSDMPTRIWAQQTSGWGDLMRGAWQNTPNMGGIEYVRSDLAAAAPELLAALIALRDDPVIKSVCRSPLWAQMVDAIAKADGR